MGKKVPAKVSPQARAAATRRAQQALDKANAQRLAQIVNLMIAGYSLADIAAATGSTADEIDRLLSQDLSRYVRSQPALRVYVRNYVSSKYTALLDAVWDEATDKAHPQKLEHQDRALRILREMERLHGAAMPAQSEVKVDAAPEAVEALVHALSASKGLGYDDSVFDVVDADVVHDAVGQSQTAALDAAERVGEDDPDDPADAEVWGEETK